MNIYTRLGFSVDPDGSVSSETRAIALARLGFASEKLEILGWQEQQNVSDGNKENLCPFALKDNQGHYVLVNFVKNIYAPEYALTYAEINQNKLDININLNANLEPEQRTKRLELAFEECLQRSNSLLTTLQNECVEWDLLNPRVFIDDEGKYFLDREPAEIIDACFATCGKKSFLRKADSILQLPLKKDYPLIDPDSEVGRSQLRALPPGSIFQTYQEQLFIVNPDFSYIAVSDLFVPKQPE